MLALLLSGFISGCLAGELCTYKNAGSSTSFFMNCDTGCCGDENTRYCCSTTSTALYVGAITGGAVCIILIIGIAVCCAYNFKGKKTRVRRHRPERNDSSRDDEVRSSRVYRHPRMPKPPPYFLPPPEYSAEPPPRYFSPDIGQMNQTPGYLSDDIPRPGYVSSVNGQMNRTPGYTSDDIPQTHGVQPSNVPGAV